MWPSCSLVTFGETLAANRVGDAVWLGSEQRLEVALHETRFADWAAAFGMEHEVIAAASLVFRDLLSQQGHDPLLELEHAAA